MLIKQKESAEQETCKWRNINCPASQDWSCQEI